MEELSGQCSDRSSRGQCYDSGKSGLFSEESRMISLIGLGKGWVTASCSHINLSSFVNRLPNIIYSIVIALTLNKLIVIMRVLICFVVFLATVSALPGTDEEIKAIFDQIVADDEMTLNPGQYAFRLRTFVKHFRDADEDTPVTSDMAFTVREKLNRLGGIRSVEPEDEQSLALAKRQMTAVSLRLSRVRAPPAYDSRRSIGLNKAVNQQTCGNCYIHTFLAALEIAYKKATGKLIKFSEQELTDCFYKGCSGGDFRYLTNHVGFLDKLSLRSDYGPYKSTNLTCRTSTTPDALTGLKVYLWII
eukprot:sb/3479662/